LNVHAHFIKKKNQDAAEGREKAILEQMEIKMQQGATA